MNQEDKYNTATMAIGSEILYSIQWGKNLSATHSEMVAMSLEMLIETLERKPFPKTKPKVVCLCGSTRFYKEFQQANYDETMAGRIVLSVGFYPHSSQEAHGEIVGCDDAQKIALDELHKRKIDLCDEVLVLNVGGYVGRSTVSEIEYAARRGKPIRYLEPQPVAPTPSVEQTEASDQTRV